MSVPSPTSGRPPSPRWRPPSEFDEYRLLRPIGRGSNGRVYLAHDRLLERTVAVKFLPAPDSTALARFLVEARAMARLQHPNVVTLYRVGQLEDSAYLVSEYVKGASLDRLRKPLPWRQVLDYGMDLARGLHAAHQRGVLHRDIKPGNAVVTESGAVKLVDFGLARLDPAGPPSAPPELEDASGPRLTLGHLQLIEGGQIGTPYFMSPEAWRGEELTVRSDLFSLGAVLFELVAGRGPFRDIPFQQLGTAMAMAEARPIAQLVPHIEPRFAAAIDRCLRRDAQERFASAADLLDALEEILVESTPAVVPEGNPYRGLQVFDVEHRAFFFGRRRELRAVIERLRAESFVLLIGDSGMGKSSLCLAGVLPRVREGGLEDGRQWRVARFVPGRNPLTALAVALAEAMGRDEHALESLLRSEPAQLARQLRAELGARRGLLVYADQMEELLTLSPRPEAARLGEALAHFCLGTGGLRLLGSARSDFLTRLASLPGLGAEIPRALQLLRPMQPEEIREAVVGPARVKGFRFESEQMVQELVSATVAATGGLPLLQFALAELWEARDASRGLISYEALARVGGVLGALERHADGVLGQLLPDQRIAARNVLLRLIGPDGTRVRRSTYELVGEDPRFRAALEALVRGRLLVASEATDETAYEIAHEALLAGWGTLARWRMEEAERREVQKRLESAAADWERLSHPPEALWSGRQLLDVHRLEHGALTERAQRFVKVSERSTRRTRLLRGAVVLGFLLAIVLVSVIVRYRQELVRHEGIDELLERARQSLGQARSTAAAVEELRGKAFLLFAEGRKQEAELLWSRVQELGQDVERTYTRVGDALEKALLLGEDREDVRTAFADHLFERAERADTALQPVLRDLLLQRMRLYDDEEVRQARWVAPARLHLETEPPGAQVEVSVYQQKEARYVLGPSRPLGTTPLATELEPGSYLLHIRKPGMAEVRYPLLVTRGEHRPLRVPLLPASALPEGFVHIPPGRFFFGSLQDDHIREFLKTVPLHPAETGGYLIARHETTFGEWLQFLEALPPRERELRRPRVGTRGLHGYLELRQRAGAWELLIQPNARAYHARVGELLRYQDRTHAAEHDWLRLPVIAVSYADAQAYVSWLDRSGRLPGARLCTDHEWERAARGADTREYPHGERISPREANFDLTYGKKPAAFGPDVVGSHPASESPFGLHDMSGNVFEWVRSSLDANEIVARGGSFYFGANASRITNREMPEATMRDLNVGFRVCASVTP